MTVEQLAESIIRQLGDDTDEKFDERLVLNVADTIRATLLFSKQSITGEYTKRFHEPLIYDEHSTKLVLPCLLSGIKENKAFVYVGTEDGENNFIPLRPAQVANIANLDCGTLGGRTGYWQEGDELRFKFLPIPPPEKLLLKLVPSMFWLFDNSDDELAGTDDDMAIVMEGTIEKLKMRKATPVNNYNSNNPR